MTTLPARMAEPIARVNARHGSPHLGAFERLSRRLSARLARLMRWEFWPSWVLYAFLVPHFVRLAIKHRSLTAFTAANPGIPLGGLVGESKWDILSRLPREAIVPTAVIEAGRAEQRCAELVRVMDSHGWSFPIILKPDVGERGSGVRLVRGASAALAYFENHPERVLCQVYHSGPFEAGVFYVRSPSKSCGRIFSITDKVPPRVVGDGRSSLEALIWRHPRCSLQAEVLLDRLGEGAGRVPEAGEIVLLAVAGNHCQGTMFREGAHLITPALSRAIDRIARTTPGLCFGRFDIRYERVEEFKAGRGFEILELNGVLSESTNMYDPEFGLFRGLSILAHQWELAFRIGDENQARGARRATVREVLRAVIKHRVRRGDRGSD